MKILVALVLLFSMKSEANECFSDTKKFCSGIEPGKGQIARCLSDYQTQLTPECAKGLKEFKAKSTKNNPCFVDLTEYCSDIPSDARRLEYCLLRNEEHLSSTCSADFKQKKGNLIVRDVCAQDIANTCYSAVTEPEGAIARCLIKNKAKLNGYCQKVINKNIDEMRKANPCFDETEKYCPTQVKFIDIHSCMEKKLPVLSVGCKKVVQAEIDKEKANPCYMDLRKHCKNGLNAVEQHHCLTVNEKELTNACNQYRIQEDVKVKKMVDLCEQDRLKLCPTAPFKNGLVLKCLKINIEKVSQGCKVLIK